MTGHLCHCLLLVICLVTTGPASPPKNITTIVLLPTSILVTWEEISVFEQNSIIIAYEVLYEPIDNTFGGAEAINTTNACAYLS